MNVSILDPKTIQIGGCAIPRLSILAPMAGYTDLPFRLLCKRFGAGLVFTEVSTVEGIIRLTPRTMHYLETVPQERPLAAHIYGSNLDSLVQACRVLEKLGKFDLIDLNCGCPVRKIVRRGAGVALIRDPDRLRDIVRAMTEATSLPVTVKTRIGLSPKQANFAEVAQAIEEGGAKALYMHARFASDMHRGPPHLNILKQVKDQCSIPVIGNGGILSAHDALHMVQETGVNGVMIGRAALGNPWIFREMQCVLTGEPFQPPTPLERRNVMAEHLDMIYERTVARDRLRKRTRHNSESAACFKFRAHLINYLVGIPGVKDLRHRMDTLVTRQAIMDAVDQVLF